MKQRKLSKRKYRNRLFMLSLVMSALVITGALLLNTYMLRIDLINKIALWAILGLLLVLCITYIYISFQYDGIKRFFRFEKVKDSIEKNLISIQAYEEIENRNYLNLPKVRVFDDEIRISYENIKFRNAIDKYQDNWSTALPNNCIVKDSYISENANQFIIKYEDLSTYKPEIYTVEQFKERVRVLADGESIYFDKNHILKFNHALIGGVTGSGKTVLVRNLVLNCIFKKYEVIVLDLKGSYEMFKPYIEQIVEPQEMLNRLIKLDDEVIERQRALQEHYAYNPDIVATDIGYKPIYVVVEEMKALSNWFEKNGSKEDKKKFDSVINNLVSLARASSIHVISVIQNPSAKDIDTSTRGQFEVKILLGNNQKNIEETAFGEGVTIPYRGVKLKTGQGGIMVGNKVELLRPPYVKNLSVDSIKTVM